MPTLFATTLLITLSSSCSFEKMLNKGIAKKQDQIRPVFEAESDLELAETALAASLKNLEMLGAAYPDSRELNLLLAESYAVYTLAFVEDTAEELAAADPEKSRYHKERALALYLRARSYAEKELIKTLEINPTKMTNRALREALEAAKKEHVREIFWYAFAWSSAINLNRENITALGELALAATMMERVRELDESYYFSGALLFEGIYYGSRPIMLGGNPQKSAAAFEKAMELTEGKILMIPYYYAAAYCVQFQDLEKFRELVNAILQAPVDIHPGQILANQVARRKTQRLAKKAPDLFIDF